MRSTDAESGLVNDGGIVGDVIRRRGTSCSGEWGRKLRLLLYVDDLVAHQVA